jgi:hypothetical protein
MPYYAPVSRGQPESEPEAAAEPECTSAPGAAAEPAPGREHTLRAASRRPKRRPPLHYAYGETIFRQSRTFGSSTVETTVK